ncbi:MAG: MFS transporter [Chloroflexi bacterium]|nr:MFS transporter [Chloroflexota bacterium]
MDQHAGHAALSAEPRARVPRLRTFTSLRHRNYRFLWGSTLFTSAGNWLQQVTLGWLVYDMTGNAFLVGALQGARAVPFLVAGPIGGVLSDRMDRRKLLIVNQVFLGLLAVGFAMLVSSGRAQVWHLFAFTILSGAGWALNNPLRQALVPNTVPREDLMNAIALNSVAFNVNRVTGPAVGGLLIAFFGPGTNFFIQAACYAGVALMVFPIRLPYQNLAAGRRASAVSDLVEGLRYVVKEQTTLALILVAMIPSLFMMPFTSGLMPVFAKDVLKVGPEGLGLLLSVFGVGALVGTMTLASLGNVSRKGLLVLGTAIFAGVAVMAFSRATSMAFALPFIAAAGAAHMLYNALNNTIIQSITPDALRGRVMSIYMLDHGLVPLGSFLAGSLAHFYGSPLAILAGGASSASLILLVGLRFKAVRSIT